MITTQEDASVVAEISDSSNAMWIGLTDVAVEGEYQWNDGTGNYNHSSGLSNRKFLELDQVLK